jgi:hypothetical protein
MNRDNEFWVIFQHRSSTMRMNMSHLAGHLTATPMAALLGLGMVLAIGGCGTGPVKPDHIPDLTPLTITVNYNGQPVHDANVLLAPTSGQYSAAGTTDQAGRAIMKTDATYDGVVPGEYRVSVTKIETPNVDIGETPEDPAKYAEWVKMQESLVVETRHLIPERYASFGTSELSVTVDQGTSSAEETLELTD